MKSVLISIQPKWCELIASGKKTVEVRKTRPKLETPFKCYVYQTKGHTNIGGCGFSLLGRYRLGKVIGEFVCDKIDYFSSADSEWAYMVAPAGSKMPMHEDTALRIMQEQGCLSLDDIIAYFGDEDYKAYFWHISDLVIYDKPRKLSEFYTVDYKAVNECIHRERVYNNPDYTNGAWLLGSYVCNKDETDWCTKCKTKPLSRPPQSWCYVEE